MNLHDKCKEMLLAESSMGCTLKLANAEGYMPHMSLVYGDKNVMERVKKENLHGKQVDHVGISSGLSTTHDKDERHMHVVSCDGFHVYETPMTQDITQWKQVAYLELKQSTTTTTKK